MTKTKNLLFHYEVQLIDNDRLPGETNLQTSMDRVQKPGKKGKIHFMKRDSIIELASGRVFQ